MPRLSCVIPVVGSTHDLETTLVSVLEKRPDDCEIIAVLSRPYDDPYRLADEVRFVEMPGAGMAACATRGIQLSRGRFVHLLAAGVEVAEGWADAALAHFDDAQVGSVTPVIRDAEHPKRILAAGVQYHCGGGRKLCTSLQSAIGPTIEAGFYRKSALLKLGDRLASEVGDRLADVDLALGLMFAGFRNVVEGESVVFAERLLPNNASGFQSGLFAERLFLRNLPVTGWLPAFLLHPLTVVGELLKSLPRGTTPMQLAGRVAAWLKPSEYRLHHHWLDVAKEMHDREIADRETIIRMPNIRPAKAAGREAKRAS